MTTLTQFIAEVRSAGNFATDDTRITDAVVTREINRALKRIALVHDWPWLQVEGTVNVVANTNTYALPADFLRLISLRHTDTAENLYIRSIQELDQYLGTSRPMAFAVWGGNIVLAATPNGTYTLKLRYIKQETVLVAGSDTPVIPSYWDEGVIEAAVVQLLRISMRMDEATAAEERFQTWLRETQDNIRQTRGTPRVRVRRGSSI